MASPVKQVTKTPGLAHYLASAVLARTADEGARVALILLALDRTGSAAVGGTLVATLLIPHVVAAPVVGALVDRSRRPAVVLAGLIALFAAGLAGSVLLLGQAPLWLTYVALAVAGCCGPAVTGGLTSRLASLAGPAREARAFGLDSMFYNIAGMAGPALAGLLAATASPGVATSGLAVAAALGSAGVATLQLPASGGRATVSRSAGGTDGPTRVPGLLDGTRAVVKDPALRALTLTTAFGQLGPGGLAVVATALAAEAHAPARAGLLLGVLAAGAFAGSLLWTWRPLPDALAPKVTAWSMVAFGIPLVVAAGVRSLPLIAALFVLSGLSTGPFVAALFLSRSHLSTEAIRTQVFTIGAGTKVAFSALGAALLGFAAHLPVGGQLLIVAASPVLAGLACAAFFSDRGRSIDRGPARAYTSTTVN